MRNFYLSVVAAMLLAMPAVSGAAESNPKQAVAAKAAGQLGQEMGKKLTESMQNQLSTDHIDHRHQQPV